jgi:hypothetical protein
MRLSLTREQKKKLRAIEKEKTAKFKSMIQSVIADNVGPFNNPRINSLLEHGPGFCRIREIQRIASRWHLSKYMDDVI